MIHTPCIFYILCTLKYHELLAVLAQVPQAFVTIPPTSDISHYAVYNLFIAHSNYATIAHGNCVSVRMRIPPVLRFTKQ